MLPIADRVTLFGLGQVVWTGDRGHLDEQRIEEVYLGTLS